jgi:hypothetical protein
MRGRASRSWDHSELRVPMAESSPTASLSSAVRNRRTGSPAAARSAWFGREEAFHQVLKVSFGQVVGNQVLREAASRFASHGFQADDLNTRIAGLSTWTTVIRIRPSLVAG